MTGIDQNTKLLLHCDGPNGSTAIADAMAHVQTAHNTAQISTAQARFGGASLKLTRANADRVSVAGNLGDFDFGAGDFTIDYWVYETTSGVGAQCHLAREHAATFSPWLIGYGGAGGTGVYMSSDGSSWDVAAGKSMGAPVFNAWSHLEISREGNTFRIFRDGTLTDSWTSSAALPACANPVSLGSSQGGNHFDGYLDEIRISKGVCRHNANFTPPAEPYSYTLQPPVYGQVVAKVVADFHEYVDLVDPYAAEYPCDHYQIEFYHAASDIETPPDAVPGALLTAYVSTDGVNFDSGPHYNNTGTSNFPGEANPAFLPQPFALGLPQRLTYGMRLSVDAVHDKKYGATGIANVLCVDGVVAYVCKAYKGAIGATADAHWPGTSTPYFPSDGNAPWSWAIPHEYAGHYDGNAGQRPRAFRLKMDGGGQASALIESGTFKLRRMQGVEP